MAFSPKNKISLNYNNVCVTVCKNLFESYGNNYSWNTQVSWHHFFQKYIQLLPQGDKNRVGKKKKRKRNLKKKRKRKAPSMEGQKILQVETFFFSFWELFQFFSVEEGRMAWWIKVEVLLTVQRVGPWSSPGTDILCNPKQVITSQCPSSSSLKTRVKPCLLALSGKDTQLRSSISQSLKGFGREWLKIVLRCKLPTANGRAAFCPSGGAQLFLPAQHPKGQPALGGLASRGTAMALALTAVFSKIKDGQRQNMYS